MYHADAIFHDKEYRNAACKYSMALQQKKVLSKTSKVRTSTSGAAANMQAQVGSTGACTAPGSGARGLVDIFKAGKSQFFLQALRLKV